MKSIKLASGFAVSALALAIAGQATAQTQTSMSATGEIKFQTIWDIENSQYYHSFDERMPVEVEDDDEVVEEVVPVDGPIFNVTINVKNGPFSGDVILGEDEGKVAIQVDNLQVNEGPISFGDIGGVTDSAGLYEGLVEETALGDEDEDTRFGVNYGFRYTESSLGLSVQAESEFDSDLDSVPPSAGPQFFGLAAAIHQDLDVAEFWLDGQYRLATATDGMENEATYNVGVALKATPVDQVTLTGVYRIVDDNDDNDRSVYAVKLDVQATDEVSLYALILDKDVSESDSIIVRGGLTASVAPFVVEAGYEANLATPSAGLIFTSATWTDGPLSASVGLDYNLAEFSDTDVEAGFKVTAGGKYTTVSGIVYGAEYTYADENFWDEDDVVSQVELFASYSF